MSEQQALVEGFDERGIPTKSDYPGNMSVAVMYGIFSTILTAIGLGIAFAVHGFGSTSKYDAKIDTLAVGDYGWVYMALVVMKVCHLVTGVNLGTSRKECKVNLPDQHVYKVYQPNGDKPIGYVLMETEGTIGRFNRAQRAVQNNVEIMPLIVANFFLAAYVFPFPAFVALAWFGVCRVVYAYGYTLAPKSRMSGTMLAMFGQQTLEGLVLLAGVKALAR